MILNLEHSLAKNFGYGPCLFLNGVQSICTNTVSQILN